MAKAEKIPTQSPTEINPTAFSELVKMGIPISVAVFHRPIQSFGQTAGAGEPETALYEAGSGSKPSRTGEMLYTPHGLICKQKHGTSIVPLANVVFARVK